MFAQGEDEFQSAAFAVAYGDRPAVDHDGVFDDRKPESRAAQLARAPLVDTVEPLEEVIPGAVAKQVRQVAALQGNVLQKTQAVMILMTVLSLIAAAVAVANLMVASIGERSGELALLKALGATDAAVSRLMLAETAAISLLGAIVGALLGSGVAQLIGRVVFGSGITMRPMVFVLVFVLLAVTVLLASASSIRSILNLKPAEVLHGR